MKYMYLLLVFLVSVCANDFTQYNIKQNNQIKTILVQSVNGEYFTTENYKFGNNSKLVIRFKTITPQLINNFEDKYQLIFEQVLISDDYIYTIQKDDDILQLLQQIVNENNVIQAKPLWAKKVYLR